MSKGKKLTTSDLGEMLWSKAIRGIRDKMPSDPYSCRILWDQGRDAHLGAHKDLVIGARTGSNDWDRGDPSPEPREVRELIERLDAAKTKGAPAQNAEARARDMYVAGWVTSWQDRRVDSAALLKNGEIQHLSGCESRANAVFVLGDDVLVAGHEGKDGQEIAMLWRNGVEQRLGVAARSSAESVHASGEDVYAAGWEEAESGTPVATLWKNGTPERLSDKSSMAHSVFAHGCDVYVAGYAGERGYESAVLWKNGVAQVLSDSSSEALSVFVSGDDVYVAGSEASRHSPNVATLWKNGVPRALSGSGYDSDALSVHVSDGDVYIAGWEAGNNRTTFATLWKNCVSMRLGSIESEARSVCATGGDAYTAGWAYDSNDYDDNQICATLWENCASGRHLKLFEVKSVFVRG
jgi:hypothetical protein